MRKYTDLIRLRRYRKKIQRCQKKYIELKRAIEPESKRPVQLTAGYYSARTLSLLLFDDVCERDYLDLLAKRVFPELPDSPVCFDVGGYIGNHALYFSQYFERVYTFEPYPNSYQLLCINTENCDNVFALNLGCGSKYGKFFARGRSPDTLSLACGGGLQRRNIQNMNLSSRFAPLMAS